MSTLLTRPPLNERGSISSAEFSRRRETFGLTSRARLWELGQLPFSATGLPGGSAAFGGEPVFSVRAAQALDQKALFETDDVRIYVNERTVSSEGGVMCSSIFHLLAVPRRRVYNAVTLRAPDVGLVQRMVAACNEFALLNADACVAEQIRQAGPERAAEFSRRASGAWRDFLRSKEPLRLGFFFHAHPDHTVGHLHLHCFPLNTAIRMNRAHDDHCLAAGVVLGVLTQR